MTPPDRTRLNVLLTLAIVGFIAIFIFLLSLNRLLPSTFEPAPTQTPHALTLAPPLTAAPETVTPTPHYHTPIPTADSSDEVEYRALFEQFSWPVEEAVMVCTCENRDRDPSVISKTEDYGLCGINQVHIYRVGGDLSRLLIGKENVRVAYAIWLEQGWFPWRYSYECHRLR